MSKIILLNGVGSSGKTSIARSIQHLGKEPWLAFGVDTFIEMMPYPSPGKAGEYFSFASGENIQGPLMRFESTDIGNKLFGVIADFAELLANHENNLIIDEVLCDDEDLKPYVEKLAKHKVYFIGVMCDLPIAQEREYLRQDKGLGVIE
jgi:chloramphenicol 3-O phosphotransferase